MISDQLLDRGRSHGQAAYRGEKACCRAVFGQGRDVSAAGVTDGFWIDTSH